MARKEDSQVTKRVSRRMELNRQGMFNFPSRPKNIPWYLLHRYLFNSLGILRLERWDNLLKKYVNDPDNGVKQTPEHRTSARGNLTAQVFSEDEGMSINTFIKASAAVGVQEIEFLVVWKMPDGKRVVGKLNYPLTSELVSSLADTDEEVELIEQVQDFLSAKQEKESTGLRALIKRLVNVRKRKENVDVKQ